MGVTKGLFGIVLMFLNLGIAISIAYYLPNLSRQQVELIQYFFLALAVVAPIIGFIERD